MEDHCQPHLPAEETVQALSDLFKLFSDPTRMRILCALFGGELCVLHIAQAIDATQSAVSHQLRLLKAGGLIKSRREGKQMYYSLDDEHVGMMIRMGLEHVRHEHGGE